MKKQKMYPSNSVLPENERKKAFCLPRSPGTKWLGCEDDEYQFVLQPIVKIKTGELEGYELLFRGEKNISWIDVDNYILNFLSGNRITSKDIYVNISNLGLLEIPNHIFSDASTKNNVIFEVSEKFDDADRFELISKRVNELIKSGLSFSIDDFGNGRDGLLRLYSFDHISSVKIDGEFLAKCFKRPDAARVLKNLISQWEQGGILTIAECIETEVMLDFVQSMGFSFAQGWYIDSIISSGNI